MNPADLQEALRIANQCEGAIPLSTNWHLARAVLHLHARMAAAEKVCEVVGHIDHDDDCTASEDDHAPDFACECGAWEINHRMQEWRSTREGKGTP